MTGLSPSWISLVLNTTSRVLSAGRFSALICRVAWAESNQITSGLHSDGGNVWNVWTSSQGQTTRWTSLRLVLRTSACTPHAACNCLWCRRVQRQGRDEQLGWHNAGESLGISHVSQIVFLLIKSGSEATCCKYSVELTLTYSIINCLLNLSEESSQ
jgi:hypothetical protein